MTKNEEKLFNELKNIAQLKVDFNFDEAEMFIVEAYENVIFVKYIKESKETKENE